MNIIFIGMRGSGKSTIANLLSKKVNRPFVETDNLICNVHKMTVSQIVEKFGWPTFRRWEKDITSYITCLNGFIISTGGGIVCEEENILNLKKSGVVFWLTAKLNLLAERIKGDKDRPPLTGEKSLKDELRIILKEREKLYKKAADYIIDTSHNLPDESAEKIVKLIKSNKIL